MVGISGKNSWQWERNLITCTEKTGCLLSFSWSGILWLDHKHTRKSGLSCFGNPAYAWTVLRMGAYLVFAILINNKIILTLNGVIPANWRGKTDARLRRHITSKVLGCARISHADLPGYPCGRPWGLKGTAPVSGAGRNSVFRAWLNARRRKVWIWVTLCTKKIMVWLKSRSTVLRSTMRFAHARLTK